jgi:hypothetical protein
MKTSLAFMGAILVAFATGALLNNAIETRGVTSTSHPGLVSQIDDRSSAEGQRFAPDSVSLAKAAGVFAPNLGQVPHDVYFQFISPEFVAHFQAGAIELLPTPGAGSRASRMNRVKCRFVGANIRPEVEATRTASRRLTYSVRDRDGYMASVPLFSELRYEELYAGVDLQISATPTGIVRSFTFAPGVPVSTLLMHFEGAASPTLSPSSRALSIPVGSHQLTYAPPVAYQVVDGERTAVAAEFEIRRYGAVGLKVGSIDPLFPLVVEVKGI